MQYFDRLRELLSLEYNCSPDDFLRRENVLTVSALHEGRRQYIPDRYFFSAVTLGGNTVVTANECMQEFLADYVKKVQGHWLFELPNLLPIEQELQKHGFTLTQAHHMFLPSRQVEPNASYPVKWFYDEEIRQFYGDERFPNAICPQFLPERPDRIVVCAYDGDVIWAWRAAPRTRPTGSR